MEKITTEQKIELLKIVSRYNIYSVEDLIEKYYKVLEAIA